ncbi:MAG: GTP-binding protein, partial [Planctomycetota bacterium]|nr:GTP-binding protein [Planctomycetota bacterium]
MPASKPQDIRNIVLLGHGGAGKATLAEAMLHAAKVTGRLGSVDDGTSHLDFSDIEKERKHTVDPAAAHFEYGGAFVNLIDAPGYPDFIGGAISALAGADVALVVVSASAGIEVNTRRLLGIAKDLGLSVAMVINKIDAENVELERLLESITEMFGTACKPVNLPANGAKAVVDCFTKEAGAADFSDVADAHTQLVESVVEADEAMMEAYLGGETVSPEKLGGAFAKAMVAGSVIPVAFTSALERVGVTELMTMVAKYFPSPAQAKSRPVHMETEDGTEVALTADPSKPFIGQAFKITTDPFVGKLAWVRVLQGTILPDTVYHVRDERKTMKVGHLFKIQGKDTVEAKTCVAGDIVALAKVEDIKTGDVLHVDAHAMYRAMPPFPTPMYSLAVTPKSRGDEQKISEALSKLAEEDPTFTAGRDAQTAETVINGIGDLHLRIMLTKMKDRFDMHVDSKPPKIPYKETISMKAEGHHRHKKQTGGSGQFGEV